MTDADLSTERLWELLSDRLRGFFARRVADAQVAEDLLQETFVRIHQGLDQLEDGRRFEPWVFQIARNLVIDFQRSRRDLVLEEGGDAAEEPGGEVEEENLNGVVQVWLLGMLDRLPEPQAEALRMYEFEGLTQRAIAKRLGIALPTVKSRVQRGREALKRMLFECCSFESDRRGNLIGYARRGRGGCEACGDEAG